MNFESVSDFILNSCAVLNKWCWCFLCSFTLCIWRCVLRPVRHLLCVLRYPCVFPGDGPGSVHQWRRHHLLEESLPTVWGWEITFYPTCTEDFKRNVIGHFAYNNVAWFSSYDNFKYFICFHWSPLLSIVAAKQPVTLFNVFIFNLRQVSATQHRWSKLISTCTTSWSLPGPSSTSSTALPPSCHGLAVDTIGIQVGCRNNIKETNTPCWADVLSETTRNRFSQEIMCILTWTCRSVSTENCVDYYGENATNITSLNATSPVIEFWE